jgi:hypothetical protein
MKTTKNKNAKLTMKLNAIFQDYLRETGCHLEIVEEALNAYTVVSKEMKLIKGGLYEKAHVG